MICARSRCVSKQLNRKMCGTKNKENQSSSISRQKLQTRNFCFGWAPSKFPKWIGQIQRKSISDNGAATWSIPKNKVKKSAPLKTPRKTFQKKQICHWGNPRNQTGMQELLLWPDSRRKKTSQKHHTIRIHMWPHAFAAIWRNARLSPAFRPRVRCISRWVLIGKVQQN